MSINPHDLTKNTCPRLHKRKCLISPMSFLQVPPVGSSETLTMPGCVFTNASIPKEHNERVHQAAIDKHNLVIQRLTMKYSALPQLFC